MTELIMGSIQTAASSLSNELFPDLVAALSAGDAEDVR